MKYPEQVQQIIRTIKKQLRGELMTTQDNLLKCPKCGRYDLQFGNGWQCLWKDCLFQTYEIPSFHKVEQILHSRNERKLVEDIQLLEGLDEL